MKVLLPELVWNLKVSEVRGNRFLGGKDYKYSAWNSWAREVGKR